MSEGGKKENNGFKATLKKADKLQQLAIRCKKKKIKKNDDQRTFDDDGGEWDKQLLCKWHGMVVQCAWLRMLLQITTIIHPPCSHVLVIFEISFWVGEIGQAIGEY